MKRLLASSDTALVDYLRGLLAARGIAVYVRNPVNAGSAAGEVPPSLAPPELWVVRSEDHAIAERLVKETVDALAHPSGGPWRCPDCGENLEAQFDVCWRCGTPRPEQS